MAKYRPIEENVEVVTEFQGQKVLHPVYQCEKCGHSISPEFDDVTGICGMCYDGMNELGEYIECVYTVSIYCNEFSNHELTNAIGGEVKKGEYAEEMARILNWGIENFDNLGGLDFIVPPPRGSDDASINHMKEIGEVIASDTGISLQDPLRKETDYESQKNIDDALQRIDNIEDNIKCVQDFDSQPVITVIDDIATSTGTLKYSAKALKNSGAKRVFGLAISRSESISDLTEAKVYEEVEGDD
jgi:hypothetical protein